jgi:alpha 1,2-mannosyltransferase
MKIGNFLIFRMFIAINLLIFLVVLNLFKNEVYITSTLYESQLNKTFSPKLNACILVLCQENDIYNVIQLIKQFEFYFNKDYNYPYVFFNNKYFTAKFKHELNKHTSSQVNFAQIPDEHWRVPDWIDRARLRQSLSRIGFGLGYRLMCRFYSGFFYKHEMTRKYEYFLRLDDDSKFNDYVVKDPFLKLQTNQTQYGFTIAVNDREYTIKNLWSTIRMWANRTNVNLRRENNGIDFISNDGGVTLSNELCIFYNNFEMANFNMFRSREYEAYFEFLERAGGFFYERWVWINSFLKFC